MLTVLMITYAKKAPALLTQQMMLAIKKSAMILVFVIGAAPLQHA
jgi:hypothetical protein